jgi:putative Mg2+ transporter-C (MgtC) family protein
MQWLVGDWWRVLPVPAAAIALATVAIVCGAIVGAERERREKPAGLRTLVLVCLGSAVFTMASFAFSTTTGDSGRVAAQIVTGIGFLGGGVILREASGVTGTTTAASIWTTAAMGMVAGAGRGGGAITLAVAIRVVLSALHAVEERRLLRVPPTVVLLTFDPDHGKTQLRIEKVLVDFEARYELEPVADDVPGRTCLRLRFRLPQRHQRELLAELAGIPLVHEIREHGAAQSVDAARESG